MNTAQLRKAANEAERRLDWKAAADLYQQAIDAFPYSGNEAQLHIDQMAQRRDAAKAMARDLSSWAPGDLATMPSGLGGKVDVRLLAKTPDGNWQVRVDMPKNPDFHGWMVETGEDNLQPYSGPNTRRGRLSDRLEAGVHPINPNVGQ